MNLKLSKNYITIEHEKINIKEIDFILLNGKLRIYKNNGSVMSILDGYTKQDRLDTINDLAYMLQNVDDVHFVSLNGGKLININNITSLSIYKDSVYLKTNGFSLEIQSLTNRELALLQPYTTQQTILI